MKRNFKIILVIAILIFGCHSFAVESNNANNLCEKISDLKNIPFKNDIHTDDPIYNGFMKLGPKAIPCLIEKLTDTTPMNDPREAPKINTKIGDVALFMLARITNISEEEWLPDAGQNLYVNKGIYGYMEYVENPKNRRELQEYWRKLFDSKKFN